MGLLGSALLAWGLGWAKTYILALVSERIGADLRTATFEHLLDLSLDYFGGKRTGDLMSRIGSESDRICVFLSLHALDFATDVLMIGKLLKELDAEMAEGVDAFSQGREQVLRELGGQEFVDLDNKRSEIDGKLAWKRACIKVAEKQAELDRLEQ